MNRLFAIGLSIATFFLSLFNVLGDGVKAPLDESDFAPVIRFVVASDTHTLKISVMFAQRGSKTFSHSLMTTQSRMMYTMSLTLSSLRAT